jgi:hypothetical protein
MTTATVERNLIVRDADGEWYSIPPNMEKEFISLREEMFELDTSSEEYFDARSRLEEAFGTYVKE